MKENPFLFWEGFLEFRLDMKRVLTLLAITESKSDAGNMGVDGDGRPIVPFDKKDPRRLFPNPRKVDKRFERMGDKATEIRTKPNAKGLKAQSLRMRKPNGPNILFDSLTIRKGKSLGIGVMTPKRRGHHIHGFIGGLGA